jgi:hypothetical protein
VKKAHEKQFDLVRKIHLDIPKLNKSEIARFVKVSPSTVSGWLKFSTYREYSDYTKERMLKQRHPEGQQIPIKEEPTKIAPDRTIFETAVLERLDKIISLLNLDNKVMF